MTATPRLTGSSAKSWVVTTGAFLVVYYLLPTQRARRCYLLTWATALGGFWPGMERVPDQDGTFGDWLGGWDVTVWSFLLWGSAIYFLVSMYREIFRYRRAVRNHAQLPAQPTVTEVQEVPHTLRPRGPD